MSNINITSKSEMMQLIFADLRKNIPKPLAESCRDLKSLRVHKRYASLPNMTAMGKNSSAKLTEIGWPSTPNLKFRQVTSDMQRPESSGNWDFKCLLDGRICVSTPNIPVRPNSAGEKPTDIGWRSTPNLKFCQITSDIQRLESSEIHGSECLLDGRLCTSTTNIPACPNLTGDAPELQILNTTQNTDRGSKTVVKQRRSRRTFWRQAKKFVRRLFCCCGSIDMIDQ